MIFQLYDALCKVQWGDCDISDIRCSVQGSLGWLIFQISDALFPQALVARVSPSPRHLSAIPTFAFCHLFTRKLVHWSFFNLVLDITTTNVLKAPHLLFVEHVIDCKTLGYITSLGLINHSCSSSVPVTHFIRYETEDLLLLSFYTLTQALTLMSTFTSTWVIISMNNNICYYFTNLYYNTPLWAWGQVISSCVLTDRKYRRK